VHQLLSQTNLIFLNAKSMLLQMQSQIWKYTTCIHSDWHGYAKPAGFPGKGISGKGKGDRHITRLKPLPGRRVLAGISQNGKLAH